MTSTGTDVHPRGWTQAFARRSAAAFGEALADDVVLESNVQRRPVQGHDAVMRVMGIASRVYETLVFTHEASNGPRHYLEWEATAFGGLALYGVTVLTTDQDGKIVHAAIHPRPLDVALRFSQAMRERAADVIDPTNFYGSSR
jgi:hypothetical protein